MLMCNRLCISPLLTIKLFKNENSKIISCNCNIRCIWKNLLTTKEHKGEIKNLFIKILQAISINYVQPINKIFFREQADYHNATAGFYRVGYNFRTV